MEINWISSKDSRKPFADLEQGCDDWRIIFVVSVGREDWKLEDNLGGCHNLGESSGFQSWVTAVRKEKNLRESEFHKVLFFWYKIGAERAVLGVLLFMSLMFEITTGKFIRVACPLLGRLKLQWTLDLIPLYLKNMN